MKTWIWTMGLWLVGIAAAAPVQAFDLTTPEALTYRVSWGFVTVGTARLTYVADVSGSYTLRADMKDASSLIDLTDSWEVRGKHVKDKAFRPSVYHVKQAENDYRADKTMTFDAKKKQVVYANLLDKTDVAEPLVLSEARDVLSTVYLWRLGGVEEVKKAAQVPLVGVKRQIMLQRAAGVKTMLPLAGQEIPVWKVTMTTVKDGKSGKDSWVVYLRDDATLKPVQIVAATKFGTFRATLKD